MKKENIFAKADEKFVKTTVLYADASDKLFYDAAAKTDKVAQTDLLDLFLKGVTIVKSGAYYKTLYFKTNSITCYDGTSAKTFTATV